MGKMDEPIIVVERAALFGIETEKDLTFQGTERRRDHVAELEWRMAENYQIMRRGDAEEDPAYKQPIPYAVLKQGDRYFTYKRLGGGGESRLHGKLSLGVGGHMNQVKDAADFRHILSENLSRELNEELIIENTEALDIRTIGLINDDGTEVGRVHIGVLIAIDLPHKAQISVREKDKLEGRWMSLDELTEKQVYERMESWSGFAVDALICDSSGGASETRQG
ncbi:hypothetical protein EWH99_09810 [Sporolactobacillus sp. THM7-7]|nr:hypothetical protein EWH99_09810 [Sporolactobacillus sp. THM7-7]